VDLFSEKPRLVEVLPLDGGGRPYAYRVPPEWADRAVPGALAVVPLGRTVRTGVVWRAGSAEDVPEAKMRDLEKILHDAPVLTPDLLKLVTWISGYYAAPLNSVLETMLPGVVRRGVKPVLRRTLEIARTPDDEAWAKLVKRSPKRAAVFSFVRDRGEPVERDSVIAELKVTSSVVDGLITDGLLRETAERVDREAYGDDDAHAIPIAPALNDEQTAATAAIGVALDSGAHKTLLLHGVTGSGKTEVYIDAIRRALALGGSALFLVPEVALTPQTLGRLRSRLAGEGHRVVVWHSHLSDGERFDAWMAVARGDCRVVVGARSAVFLPLNKLKLVVVDEEHESSFKQGETPFYHGRDVAVFRASLNNAVCVLGSATPSLESMHNARAGKYALIRLEKRIDDRPLPPMRIIDMKREMLKAKGPVLISGELQIALRERLERGEQSILFLNRRGHARAMICPDCAHVVMCPHCSVSMTYHRTDETLRCHLCDYAERAPSVCPECRSPKVRHKGYGTQKAEEVVRELFPKARLARIDADTMRAKDGFRRVLSAFRHGELDMLLGTQMIAKGLDFPRVTLAAVIDADISLHAPDFRAAERTFQLLTQVGGRAGRGGLAGEVIIQTMTPAAGPIQYAKKGDYEGFLEDEMAQRLEYGYPPHKHLVRHLFRGPNPEKVLFYAEQFAKKLEEAHPGLIEMRGPAACPIEKIQDNYRFHIWYTCDRVTRIMPAILAVRRDFPQDDEVVDLLDSDPTETS
jgi:primosomal protein N' (replication factor Y)